MTPQFQTPDWVCQLMVNLAKPWAPQIILEPTAGEGNLVRIIQAQFPKSTIITPKDYWIERTPEVDIVIANPPFSPMLLGYKFLYSFMEKSNKIIVLMPWLTLINSEKRTGLIKAFGLKSVTHLPRKTFPGSRVQCCILDLEKGWSLETKLSFQKELT